MESSSLKRLGTRSLAITSSAAMLIGLSAAGATAAQTNAVPDTDAPELVSFTVDPAEENLDNGEAIFTVTAKITDATGVDVDDVDGDLVGLPVLFAQSTTSTHRTDAVTLNLVDGTPQNGTYQQEIRIPVGSAAGEWQVNLVSLEDTMDNKATAGKWGAFSIRYDDVIELPEDYKFFVDEAGTANDAIVIPEVEGVTFTVNGVPAAPGTYKRQATGSVTVVGTARNGYKFDEDDQLEGDSDDTITRSYNFREVTPAPVEFTDPTGIEDDYYTIPETEGVNYFLAEDLDENGEPAEGAEALEAGTHEGTGEVRVVAVLDDSYELAVDEDGNAVPTSWTHDFSTGFSSLTPGEEPTITGDAEVGKTLTAEAGEWGTVEGGEWGPEAGVEFSYEWFAQVVPEEGEETPAAEAIEGATAATFTPSLDQLGKIITVEVTGSLDGYVSADAVRSESTDAVAEGYLTTATPAINGEAKVGETLEADAGEWGQEGVELSYQWNAGGEAIEGATERTLELTEDHLDQKISVTVTGSLENYKDTSVTSAATAPVVAESAPAPTFSDVDEDDWYFDDVSWLVDNEITTGFKDGTFRPLNPVTRGQAVTFLFRYADEAWTAPESSDLSDVPANHNFFEAITWATENGVVNGYADNTFRSSQNMTRGQVAAILFRQADVDYTAPETSKFTDVTPSDNFYDAISWLGEQDIALGNSDGSFGSEDNISRAEIAAFMERYDTALNK